MIELTIEQQELYKQIVDHFVFIHDELTQEWLDSDKSDTTTFTTRHNTNWRLMDAELIANGLKEPLVQPAPSIDLNAELNSLKERVAKLELKQTT